LLNESIPVLLVTHDIEEALTLGDHVQVIQNGSIIDTGTPVATLTQPNSIGIAQLTGIENILELEVGEILPDEGIIIAEFGNSLTLEVPYKKVEPGEIVSVGLKASDIIFSTKKPETSSLSARNILPGTVKTIEKTAVGYKIGIESQSGLLLNGHITRRSLEQLNINIGDSLWSIFKTSALFILDN
jgi:molybdate transport system ATP-binding protein